jgi:CheY-like chemotaxis protein
VSLEPLARLGRKGVKVVVADEEAAARGVIRRVLEECDAEVATGASVDEAMTVIRSQPPDVLVSDVGVPGEDGYALIQHVRARGPDNGATSRRSR